MRWCCVPLKYGDPFHVLPVQFVRNIFTFKLLLFCVSISLIIYNIVNTVNVITIIIN